MADGRDPQISVGSSSAKYLWTSGSTSPYQVNMGTETLSKAGADPSYTRALNFIDNITRSSVSIELGSAYIVRKSGVQDLIPLVSTVSDTARFDASTLLDAGSTVEFVLPADADTLFVPLAIYGHDPQYRFAPQGGVVSLVLVNDQTGMQVARFASVASTAIPNDKRQMLELVVPLGDILLAAKGAPLKIRPEIRGLQSEIDLVMSVGHIYGGAGSDVLKKASGQFEVGEQSHSLPTQYGLSSNYPNPFNPSTRIEYALPAPGIVSCRVYDLLGREVRVLGTGYHEAGYYSVVWDAASAASGVYYVRFTATDELGNVKYTKVNKVLLMK